MRPNALTKLLLTARSHKYLQPRNGRCPDIKSIILQEKQDCIFCIMIMISAILKIHVANNMILDDETFLKLVKYLSENKSLFYDLMEFFLKYLEIYPQQIKRIPLNLFMNIISIPGEKFDPLVLFLASRHPEIKYNMNFEDFPIEKLVYLLSAFYKQYPLMMCDPEFVLNIKNKINVLQMLNKSPKWFNDNEDLIIGLHAIEFDENECDELFTQLKSNWRALRVTKASLSFVDLVASKCNKDIEFIQYLIEFILLPEIDKFSLIFNRLLMNLKLLDDTKYDIYISDWDTLIMKLLLFGLRAHYPICDCLRITRLLIEKFNMHPRILRIILSSINIHPQFSIIMLNHDSNQDLKEELLRLIEIIVEKDPCLMKQNHVALYLCSYNASLSVCDQIILRILYHYDEGSLIMSNYKPYLWGSLAISRYQVNNQSIPTNFPSIGEVISYISLKRVMLTTKMFPINRMLDVKRQDIYGLSHNSSSMYDPAFFLPMIKLLITRAPLICIKQFNRKGCLSMILVCLSSEDLSIRTTAHSILKLLRFHLTSFNPESLFWDYFVKYVLGGLRIFITNSNNTQLPRLSTIEALFLSKMTLAMSYNEQVVNSVASSLLRQSPTAKFGNLENLKSFINHITIFYTPHTNWFLTLLRDGIRSKYDLDILVESNFPNIIMSTLKRAGIKEQLVIVQLMKTASMIECNNRRNNNFWNVGYNLTLIKFSLRSSIVSMNSDEVIEIFHCLQSMDPKSFIGSSAIDLWLNLFKKYALFSKLCLEGYITLRSFIPKYKYIHEYISDDDLKSVLLLGEYTSVLSSVEVALCQSALKYGPSGFKVDEIEKFIYLPSLIHILTKKIL